MFVVLKLSTYICFEISSFFSLGCCQFHIAFTAASMLHGSVLLYRCTSRFFGRLGFKLYIYSKIGAISRVQFHWPTTIDRLNS